MDGYAVLSRGSNRKTSLEGESLMTVIRGEKTLIERLKPVQSIVEGEGRDISFPWPGNQDDGRCES